MRKVKKTRSTSRSLESRKKAKSCVRKVFTKNGTLSSDPKIIIWMNSKIFTMVCTIVRATCQTVQIYSSDILKSLNFARESSYL